MPSIWYNRLANELNLSPIFESETVKFPACRLLIVTFLWPVFVQGQNDSTPSPPSFRPRVVRLEQKLDDLESNGDATKARALRQLLETTIGKAEDRLFAESRQADRTQAEFDLLVSASKKRLARLKALLPKNSSSRIAERLTGRLTDLEESWKDGTAFVPESDTPIVHWLHAVDPALAPTASKSHSDGLGAHLETTTLALDELNRPTFLVLTSDVATRWKLIGDSSNVQAVLVYGRANEFECTDSRLVFRLNAMGAMENAIDAYSRSIETQLGRTADLLLRIRRNDQTIQLGPRHKNWTRAYVMGRLHKLSRDVQTQANAAFATSESELRFPAFTVVTESFRRFSFLTEFDLNGPTSNARRPMTMVVGRRREEIGINMWNHTAVGDDEYALIQHGQLAKRGASDSEWVVLPTAPGHAGQAFRSITHDRKRNRLVALDAKGGLFALELAKSKWTFLRDGAKDLFGLAYQSSSDLIVAIRQSPGAGPGREKDTWVVYLDASGKEQRKTKSDLSDSIQNVVERTYNEFALTEDYLIATQPPATSRRKPIRSVIRVIDLKSGDVQYDHMLPATNSTESHNLAGNGITYAIYKQKFRDTRNGIERAKQFDREAGARLEKRLDELSDPIAYANRPRDEPVIYWMRTFRENAPLIRVTDKSGPIILAVSSFVLPEWRFELDEGVNVKEVIFVGLNPPKYTGLPGNVKVTNSTEDLRGNERQPSYQKSIIKELVAKTNKPVFASELDLSSSDHLPRVVVGPANTNEAIGHAITALDELSLAAGNLNSNAKVSEDFRFAYYYQRAGDNGTSLCVAECNFRGPILQTQRRLPPGVPARSLSAVAYAGRRHFVAGFAEAQIGELRLTDTQVDVASASNEPKANTRHLMFDNSTNRLLCIGHDKNGLALHIRNGGKSDAWTSVAIDSFPSNLARRVAWCHDANRQRLFAIVRKQFDITEIHEVSESGKVIRKSQLPVPIAGNLYPAGDLFSAYCDSKNIIIVMRSADRKDLEGSAVQVLDIESLATVYKGDFRPHLVYEEMSESRFLSLWERTATATKDEMEAIKWQFVAGGESTAKQIKRIMGDLDGVPREEVDMLVKQLDANTYAERKSAFEMLLRTARKHAEYLGDLSKDELSAEQRYRIGLLLEKWTDGSNRRAFASEILEQINSQ